MDRIFENGNVLHYVDNFYSLMRNVNVI